MLPKVYRVASVAPSGRQAALAAILWAGPDATVSHAAAGVLWGIAGVGAAKVELWIPPTRRLRSDLVVVHRGVVSGRDRRIVDALPVTSPARTIVDLAAGLDDESLDVAIDDVLHRGLTTPGALRARAVAVGKRGRAGSGRVQRLLDDRGDGPAAESRLETKVRRLLRSAGLRPVGQHDVVAAGRRYRLDFAWPDLRSRSNPTATHSTGRGGAFERDRQRWADLTASWRIVPVTWSQATHRASEFLARVHSTLGAAPTVVLDFGSV